MKGKEIVKCMSCQTSKRRDEMSMCSQCKVALYCQRECQLNHWQSHKKQCKALAKERKEKKELTRLQEKVAEEERASDFQASLFDAEEFTKSLPQVSPGFDQLRENTLKNSLRNEGPKIRPHLENSCCSNR